MYKNGTAGDYAHIVGNGVNGARSNAYTLDWDGNAWFAGDVTTNEHSLKAKADKTYVDSRLSTLDADTRAMITTKLN